MRLTLRTLLAYLDNTLDPQDAAALRQKLTESGFATQLVQRLRDTLVNGSLPAPSPEAVGPVEEANVISEYLDSTLPAEQVAEIERACLESDPHLAEAAACHQILTMVLGKPAAVSPELRKRIYELPDRKLQDIAGPRFSSVAIPAEQPKFKSDSVDLPTAEGTAVAVSKPVTPVGVNDSGVSDAPTRLRQAEAIAQGAGTSPKSAIAGSKAKSVDSRIYGGSIRPSRIAPWLVSLALIGILGYAMVRIFEPLLGPNKQVAQQTIGDEILIEPEDAADPLDPDRDSSNPQTASDDPEIDASSGSSGVSVDIVDRLPPPEPIPTPEATAEVEDTVTGDAPPIPADLGNGSSDVATTDTLVAPDSAEPEMSDVVTEVDVSVDVASPIPGADSEMPSPPMDDVVEAVAPPTPAGEASTSQPPPGEADPAVNGEIATVTSEKTLLVGIAANQLARLQKDAVVGEGIKIVCAPTFRAELTIPGVNVTLVGPSQIEWTLDEQGGAVMQLDFGRVLISSIEPDATASLRLGDQELELNFADSETVAAASMQFFRAPGFDPLVPENRRAIAGVMAVQGGIEMAVNGTPIQIATGQQWTKRGAAAAEVTGVQEMPGWIEAPDPTRATLESGAREGLLALIDADQPLEIALREATHFRRAEVGALAARTLLAAGLGDVYFGGDGILSEPKQHAYWPEHFMALMNRVDRSPESATRLRAAIVRMDGANAVALFRLLTGYSQKQLVEGGDEELVQLLDSSSMAVRVLALENLHKITGTTLYFRAEQENSVRRAPGIKKWIARQRKGDIRWQQ